MLTYIRIYPLFTNNRLEILLQFDSSFVHPSSPKVLSEEDDEKDTAWFEGSFIDIPFPIPVAIPIHNIPERAIHALKSQLKGARERLEWADGEPVDYQLRGRWIPDESVEIIMLITNRDTILLRSKFTSYGEHADGEKFSNEVDRVAQALWLASETLLDSFTPLALRPKSRLQRTTEFSVPSNRERKHD